MANGNKGSGGWMMPAIIGVVAFLVMLIALGLGFLLALVIGVAAAFGAKRYLKGSEPEAPIVQAPTPVAKPAPAPAAAPEPAPAEAPAAEAPAAEAPAVQPSTPLAGEAELAERKGEWTYDGDAAAEEPAAEEAPAEEAAEETPPAEDDAPAVPLVKPSTPLAGEAELAARKGSWRFEPGGN